MTARLLLLVALAGVLAACGGSAATPAAPTGTDNSPAGDIPDDQAYVAFTPPGARFSVKVPEGWSQSSQGHDVRFTDNLNAI
jgi:ABC-type glycerol-3-phosphate transport system substrate-binding protein